MGDVVFILAVIAYFAAAITYVRACERVVRTDQAPAESTDGV